MVIIRGILPLLLLYLVKLLVDEIQNVVMTEPANQDFTRLTITLIVAGGLFLINALSASFGALVKERQSFVISDFFDKLIHDKTTSLSYSFFEFPKYQNIFYRALNEATVRPSRVYYGVLGLLQNLITLVALGGILLMVHWSVSIVLLLVTVPVGLIRVRYALRLFRFKRENTVMERKVSYYNRLLTSPDYAKEIRAFDLGSLFRERYETFKTEWRKTQYRMLVKKTRLEILVQVLAAISFFLVYGLIAFKAFKLEITIGEVVLYFLALQRGYSYLQEFFGRITGLYEDSLFLDNLFEFLQLTEPANQKAFAGVLPFPKPLKSGIEFRNLGFHYPSNEKWVLKDLSFKINAGETVALVGVNGSGKTTLAKLLCSLYQPVEGSILVDGVSLNQIDNADRVNNVSVIFQDFMLYNVTARENIWFGNIRNNKSAQNVADAATKAGIDKVINGFTDGFETTLGTLFEGSEQMSPGQWQRLALARSFFNDAQVMILDEPTSSLDAYSEAKLLSYIHSITENRTALIISHRLSTVKMADRIVVLDGHKVAESGSYAELMALKGVLFNMVQTLSAQIG
jgi:ATP-binding cassette subfamily B protein